MTLPFEIRATGHQCTGCVARAGALCRALRRHALPPGDDAPRQRRVAQDATLLAEGEVPAFVGVLRRGYLREERMLPDGRRSILGLVVPGDLVGDWTGTGRNCALAAATTAEICVFDPRRLRRAAAEDAALRSVLLRTVAAQSARQLELVWRRGALTSRERIIAFLVMAAELLPSAPQPDGSVIIPIPISRRDWADLTNTTVETICRTLGYLADKDMLRAEAGGRYRIRDLAVLCRLAGMDPDLDCGRLSSAAVPADPAAVAAPVLRRA